jgi:leucyl-tRNA synthetase
MQDRYDASQVEAKWRKTWADAKLYEVDLKNAKDPFYAMVMFPYPSGDKLHIGHWYNYAPADSFARFMRMHGKDVFSPMGFDAFGLPAENYAIKTGVKPAESIKKNVETMIEQLSKIGCMYDWTKMVNTTDPSYYKWTQWLFLQMYSHDLAYKKYGNVNWCPKDQTVLANEQVKEGLCDRCGTEVIQKPLEQWFWGISTYSQQLLDGLDDLDWPEKTKIMQRNWIGKKEGIDITYKIKDTNETLVCFTTRPDTNFGATFIVIAPEHPFAQKIADGELSSDHRADVIRYREAIAKKTEIERQAEGKKKTGAFTGYVAINNLNGREMPVWISDFVLANFGTGAVVGVPAHDVRDFEFAQTFGLPIIRVVKGKDGDVSDITDLAQVQEESGTMINSDFLDGLPIMEAKEKIKDHLEKMGWGKRIVSFRLRDWLVSRQRYWGAPIPIVYDPDGNAHPIPQEHLPWLLPTDVEFKPTGRSPLYDSKEFRDRTEKIFGKGWTPEFDTMDTFVCSSFYYLRYLMTCHTEVQCHPEPVEGSADNADTMLRRAQHDIFIDQELEKKWLPVDMYIGGPEQSCMHLIYARFVMMALKDFGVVSHAEPFKRLIHQGLITKDGAKMSKSKGNVVSPDAFVSMYGSDVFRMYLMFMGPFELGGDWSDSGIKGIVRFVDRLWNTLTGEKKDDTPDTLAAVHHAIKKVTDDITTFHFNTAISGLMEMLNDIEKNGGTSVESAKLIATIIAPLAPHLAEELWFTLGGEGFIVDQTWPTYDPARLVASTLTIAVQVNGKLRGTLLVAADASKEDIIAMAKEQENVLKFLEGATIKKEIYVPGKLISFVI